MRRRIQAWQVAKADFFDYIERLYNRKRRHSHIVQVSPEKFEKASVVHSQLPTKPGGDQMQKNLIIICFALLTSVYSACSGGSGSGAPNVKEIGASSGQLPSNSLQIDLNGTVLNNGGAEAKNVFIFFTFLEGTVNDWVGSKILDKKHVSLGNIHAGENKDWELKFQSAQDFDWWAMEISWDGKPRNEATQGITLPLSANNE